LAGHGALLLLAAAISSCNPIQHRSAAIDDTRPAHISFLSNPDGATVRVNGRRLDGTTPLEYQEVRAGLSLIEYEKEGYLPIREQHTWLAGAVTRLDINLVRQPTPTPRPTLRERPTRAAVAPRTQVPSRRRARTKPPTPGRVPTKRPSKAPTAVVPKTASVSLITTPPGATVVVNGQALQGVTPLNNVVLPAGKATVEFRLENYEPAAIERSWEPGAQDLVTAELVGLPARLSIHTTPSRFLRQNRRAIV
jgi:hypothetical protein